MKKVLLIDGNNLMFRSFFATAYSGALMRNSKGLATNALYGFLTMVNKIIEEEKPTYMVVAFDIGKNFRHEKYKEYKAGRNATPPDLISQMPIARQLLDAMGIKHLELEGYEADDIIGTLAKEADLDPEYDALIISSDHDLLQLISPQVGMKMLKSGGSATYYTKESFILEYGFEPIKIIDLKSLMGDASDNIPGVKGIGEKTARSLIQTYGSLDGVYENIGSIKGKMKEKLESDKDNAYFSYELATIYCDVPLEFNLSALTYDGPDMEKLTNILQELEFHSFLKNMTLNQSKQEEVIYKVVEKLEDIDSSKMEYAYYIECDRENYHYANILGMSLYDGTTAYYIKPELIGSVLKILSSRLRYTYGLKKNIILTNSYGITLNTDYDLMIIYYLLYNTSKDDLAIKMSEMGVDCYYYEDVVKKKITDELFMRGIVQKAKFIWNTKNDLLTKLSEENMQKLFNDMEMPLVKVLADMESTGIKVDRNILKRMQSNLKEEITSVENSIYELVGFTFNVASPKQLGEVLFTKLSMPYPSKKTSTYSTDSSILEKLRGEYPVIELILKYRTLAKLYNTYVEPLEGYIKEDGKIHTIYKQTLTRTGRLSSVDPNLQNIPEHEEVGKLIKKAFLAEDNSYLLSADYSQIELRILAHIAGDETMITSFQNGDDIHRRVAADIHNIPIEEVTKEQRSTAKSVIFGIVYGISGFGLGENLNISSKDAKNFIEKYYEIYPKVHDYMENIKTDAYKNGFVHTLFGRKRIIEELKSPAYMVRTSGERIALNTPIQGTGADIIKLAMVNLYKELKRKNLKSKILLQVHDEIILNVLESEKDTVLEMVKRNMESVVNWEVPLKVELSLGSDWYEAK